MRSGTYIALRDAVGGADLYFIKFGLVDNANRTGCDAVANISSTELEVRRFGARRRRGLPEAQRTQFHPIRAN